MKTTVAPRRDLPRNLRQLIGYALLDWSDALSLERVGFYFSRQGAWLSWPLADVVEQTAAGATLAELREEFRTLAYENSPRLTPALT